VATENSPSYGDNWPFRAAFQVGPAGLVFAIKARADWAREDSARDALE
jgi:hypothetical protein